MAIIARYRLHKWFATGMGVFLFIWIVSGIVMLLPEPHPDALVDSKPFPIDYLDVRVSPADAVESLKQRTNADIDVRNVTLATIRGQIVYKIAIRNGGAHLISAKTGKEVVVTPQLAESIARDRLLPDVGSAHITRVEKHDLTYPWGPLPTYRIEFGKGGGTIAYVSSTDGTVYFTDPMKQAWTALASFHDFTPLRLLLPRPGATKMLVLVLAVISLGVVLTGYYIALVPKRRRKPPIDHGTDR